MNFIHLCYFGLSLPLGAFFVCIFLSIFKDFHLANSTHCGVFNFLPSISACIGDFYPQNTIWRLCIGIDSFPRYLISFVYYKKYYKPKGQLMKNAKLYFLIIKCAFILHNIELTSLLVLTYVSSVEIFFIHMISFVLFLLTSSLYMLICIGTFYWPREKAFIYLSNQEQKSLRLKLRTFSVYLSCFLFSLYFYIRHNTYCEPFVYSIFSLMEYLTVLANIFYHSIIIHDLNLTRNNFKLTLLET